MFGEGVTFHSKGRGRKKKRKEKKGRGRREFRDYAPAMGQTQYQLVPFKRTLSRYIDIDIDNDNYL